MVKVILLYNCNQEKKSGFLDVLMVAIHILKGSYYQKISDRTNMASHYFFAPLIDSH